MAERFRLPDELGSRDKIGSWASRYEIGSENKIIEVAAAAKRRGYLEKSEFVDICCWKSPRPRKRYASNSSELIGAVTRISFAGDCNEELRIKILTLLNGVNMRVASALLHLVFLGDEKGYPLMDYRAFRTLGYTGKYDFGVWSEYTLFCREAAKRNGVDLRTLDRALWQYDKGKKVTLLPLNDERNCAQ